MLKDTVDMDTMSHNNRRRSIILFFSMYLVTYIFKLAEPSEA